MKKPIKYIILLSNQQNFVGEGVGGKTVLIHCWWDLELYTSVV